MMAVLIALILGAGKSPSNCAAAATQDDVWFQGSLPTGAQPQVNAANCWQEPWTWVTDNPKPFSGPAASQSTTLSGFHQHYFVNATHMMTIDPGDVLVAYVYLDPTASPTEVSMAWSDTGAPWDFKHRAFWGADSLASSDAVGSPDHYKAGDLPPAGKWVRLEVPASKVGLEGKIVNGIALSQFDGKTTWDHIGKRSGDGTLAVVQASQAAQSTNVTLSGQTSRPSSSTFASGETVSVTFRAKGLPSDSTPVSLHVSIVDEHDAEIFNTDIAARPDSAGNWTTTVAVPSRRLGFYRVMARLSNGTEIEKLGSRGSFLTYCVVPDPAERRIYPESDTRFGMQGGFNATNSILPFMGIRWVLGGYVWRDAEPRHSGQFGENLAAERRKFPLPNLSVEGLTYNGKPWLVYTVPTLYNNPPGWASLPDTQGLSTAALSPDGEKAWADYCSSAAAAYALNYPNEDQHYYQITWEPNYPWGFKGTDEQLVKIYQIAYPILHATDPKAIVLGPTAASYDANAESHWFQKGLANYIDGVAIHPYKSIPPEASNLVGDIRTLKAIVRKAAGRDLPMYGTEQGSATKEDPAAELEQAQGLLRENLIMLGEGYGFNFAFYSTDYYRPDAPEESGFGYYYNLVHGLPFGSDSISPKPIAPAYAAQSFLLDGSRSNGMVGGLGDDGVGYSFERDGQVTLALWSSGDGIRTVPVPVGVKNVNVYDWMGNQKEIPATNGYASLTLSAEPIYVTGVSATIWGSQSERAIRLAKTIVSASPGHAVTVAGVVTLTASRAISGTLVVHGSDALGLAELSTPIVAAASSKQQFSIPINIPANVPSGQYDLAVDLKDAGGLISSAQAELDVQPAVSLRFVQPAFSPSGQRSIQVGLSEEQGAAAKGRVQVVIANLPSATVSSPFTLAPHQAITLDIAEPESTISPIVIYKAYVKVVMDDGAKATVITPINFMSAPRFSNPPPVDGSLGAWSSVTPIQIAGRDAIVRSPGYYEDDLKAGVRFGWDAHALYLAIDVSKAQHIEDQTGWMTWKGDCIQLDVDLDPQQRVSHSGNTTEDLGSTHRVTEINFALTKDGPQAFRSASPDATKYPATLLGADDIRFTAAPRVGGIIYEAAIPWQTLGQTKAPSAGDRIGIAAAINALSSPNQPDPTAIGLYDGVAGKDWTKYGSLVLNGSDK